MDWCQRGEGWNGEEEERLLLKGCGGNGAKNKAFRKK